VAHEAKKSEAARLARALKFVLTAHARTKSDLWFVPGRQYEVPRAPCSTRSSDHWRWDRAAN